MHSLFLEPEADEHQDERHDECDDSGSVSVIVVEVVHCLLVHVGDHRIYVRCRR